MCTAQQRSERPVEPVRRTCLLIAAALVVLAATGASAAEPVVPSSSRLHRYVYKPSRKALNNLGWETGRDFEHYVRQLRAGAHMAQHLETLPAGATLLDTGAGEAHAFLRYFTEPGATYRQVLTDVRKREAFDPATLSQVEHVYSDITVAHNHGLRGIALGIKRPTDKRPALRLKVDEALAGGLFEYREQDLVSYALLHPASVDASFDFYGADFYVPPHIALEAQAWLLKPGGKHFFYATGNDLGLVKYLRRTRGFDVRYANDPADDQPHSDAFLYLQRNGDEPHFPVPQGDERHGNMVFDYDQSE